MALSESELIITNDTACLKEVRDLVHEGICDSHLPDAWSNVVMTAVDEAVMNIIEHAYHGVAPGSGEIKIKQSIFDDRYQILIEDNGLTFEPEEPAELDMAEHFKSGSDGGLGVFLMRRIMDVVDYSFRAGVCNRLLLVKFIKKD